MLIGFLFSICACACFLIGYGFSPKVEKSMSVEETKYQIGDVIIGKTNSGDCFTGIIDRIQYDKHGCVYIIGYGNSIKYFYDSREYKFYDSRYYKIIGKADPSIKEELNNNSEKDL